MKIIDQGIILSARKYSENSLVVKILSRDHGLISGFVKGAITKQKANNYQIANLVDFTWQARTSEQLGLFQIEVTKSFLAAILSDPIKLNALSTIVAIIEANVLEKEPHSELFLKLTSLLANLTRESKVFLANYVLLEIELLQILGYGIDLSCCVVSGSKIDLHFVSPKSGRAVSLEFGEKYRDKLLVLPQFLLHGDFSQVSKNDLLNGLKLSSFFMEKYVYQGSNNKAPVSRNRLLNLVKLYDS